MQLQRVRLIGLMLFLLAFASVWTYAQTESACGFQYTVVRGDTLSGIAQRCGVSLDALREFNAGVSAAINPGQVLFLPPPEFTPSVTLNPTRGPIGSSVTASLTGYPPNTTLLVGMGIAGEAALIATNVVTDASGNVTVRFTVPATQDASGRLFVTGQTLDARYIGTSSAFELGAAPPTPTPIVTVTPPSESGGVGNDAEATPSVIVPVVPLQLNRLAPIPAPIEVTTFGVVFDEVIVYMVAQNPAETDGVRAACSDVLVPVRLPVARTIAPLTASIDTLLRQTPAEYGLADSLINPLQATGLTVDQVTLINGEAQIRLTGEGFVPDVSCESARLQAQLAATALQYATVTRVSLVLNGQAWASLLP